MQNFDLKVFLDELVKKTIPELPEIFQMKTMRESQQDWLIKIVVAETNHEKLQAAAGALCYARDLIQDLNPFLVYLREHDISDLPIDEPYLRLKHRNLESQVNLVYTININFKAILSGIVSKLIP